MSESIKATLWDLTSVETCLQSMEREAQQLDAAKQGLTGRAWMLLRYRASALEQVVRSVRLGLENHPPITAQFQMARLLLGHVPMVRHPWDACRVADMERRGDWHAAFAIRCGESTDAEALVCLLQASFNQFRQPAQPAAQPEALAG